MGESITSHEKETILSARSRLFRRAGAVVLIGSGDGCASMYAVCVCCDRWLVVLTELGREDV